MTTIDDVKRVVGELIAAGMQPLDVLKEIAMGPCQFSGVGVSATGNVIAEDPTRVGLTLNTRPPVETRPALPLTKVEQAAMAAMRKAHLTGCLASADETAYLRPLNRSIETRCGGTTS